MASYITRRVLQAIPVLVVVAVVVFAIIHLVPGDPARVMLGSEASEAQVEALRKSMGLNLPLWNQFARWIGGMFVGNFGQSIFLNEPVSKAIAEHLQPTVMLGLSAEIIAIVVALPVATYVASRRGSWVDLLFTGGTIFGMSIPAFLVGLLLVLGFSVKLKILPVAGYTSPTVDFGKFAIGMIMPAVSLALIHMAFIARMTRSATLDVLNQNYIETARAKGAGRNRVLIRHAFRNAAISVVTAIGGSIGTLITGAIVVEVVFGIPGLGQLISNSISRRDYNTIQAIVLILAVFYVVVNLLVDLSYGLLDPKLRRGRRS